MRSNNRDIISLDFFSQINSCWHRMMDFLFTFVNINCTEMLGDIYLN